MRQKLWRIGTLIAALAVAGAAPRVAQAQCMVGWSAFGSSCYTLTPTASNSWTTAQSEAQTLGGYLTAIGSAAENSFIQSTFAANAVNGAVWIGFSDAANEGAFVWVNGEPVVFTNWSPGEPNNLGDEDYTHMYSSGMWNDLPNGQFGPYYGVVESAASTVPEPSSVVLLGGGLAAMAGVVARRRRATR